MFPLNSLPSVQIRVLTELQAEDLVALLKRDFSLLQTSMTNGEKSELSEVTGRRTDASNVADDASRSDLGEVREPTQLHLG